MVEGSSRSGSNREEDNEVSSNVIFYLCYRYIMVAEIQISIGL